jgi:hypothetical protein
MWCILVGRCLSEQPVCAEGLIPPGQVEVRVDDGRNLFVALGDQVMQIPHAAGLARLRPGIKSALPDRAKGYLTRAGMSGSRGARSRGAR